MSSWLRVGVAPDGCWFWPAKRWKPPAAAAPPAALLRLAAPPPPGPIIMPPPPPCCCRCCRGELSAPSPEDGPP